MKLYPKLSIIVFLAFSVSALAQNANLKENWSADNGDGTYTNPIIHADFSDPDVVRVEDDYYMTASSFNCVPGLPILHSKDLVNWELVNYALQEQVPVEVFNTPQHGNGVWAPCIRFHKGEYYIFYPDPDFGIYMVKTDDPTKEWSEPILIKGGKGLIDPTPLWDDDGKAYLAYAFAGSRAQIKTMLMVCSMMQDATATMKDDVMVFDGHDDHNTIEGPKFYKRNGYYYLFAPAGGVSTGWQLALRSKNVLGPYEAKIVMEQGDTPINGPHQGAWIDTPSGEDWFIHFQDKGAYGRIVHLQPMKWEKDWPIIGEDQGNGLGFPVDTYKKPDLKSDDSIKGMVYNDEFNSTDLGLQWQWHANPSLYWGFPTPYGYFKMYCKPMPEEAKSLWDIPHLLMQKWPAESFTATTKINFAAREDGERVGFLIMGRSYAYLQLSREDSTLYASQVICERADQGGKEVEGKRIKLDSGDQYLKIKVSPGGKCDFFISQDGKSYSQIGTTFTAMEGKWIGAKIGFVALRDGITNDSGSMDIDYIRFTKN